MKRFMAFVLAFTMIIGSVASAAPGDIIHIGSKKVYKSGSDELIEAIINGADIKQFYREIEVGADENRKFVNIVDEEERELIFLRDLMTNHKEIQSAEDLAEYLKSNSDIAKEFDGIGKSIATPIDEIPGGGSLEDYFGDSKTPILKVGDNYSSPVPGDTDGTTRILQLALPRGASSWIYKVGEEEFEDLEINTIIESTNPYSSGADIVVEAGKYLLLAAVDSTGQLKAYASIEIEDNMVKKPRVPANKLDDTGTVKPGTTVANAVNISGIEDSNWKYFIRSNKLSNIFTDDEFDDAVTFTNGEDIVVADESTTIDDNFKRYVHLINIDADKIKEYVVKEISKNDISKLPDRLVEGTHYIGPVPGNTEGTTKFSELEFGSTGGSQWMYKIGDVDVPIADSTLGDGFTIYNDGQDIEEVKVGQKLFLAATDGSGRIKAYAMFVLGEGNISGEPAKTFNIKPKKGEKAGNTMVSNITLPEGTTKWMYAIGKDMSDPFLDRVYEGSKDYTLGRDIEAEIGDVLYIFATDDGGRVKEYGMIELDGDHIRNPSPASLFPGIHYSEVEKGDDEGQSIIKTLATTDSIKDVDQWMYKLVQDNIPVMEFDGMIEGATAYTAGENIVIANKNADNDFKNNDKFARKLILLGTKGNPTDYKIKGYAVLDLNNTNVKMPKAGELVPDPHYSDPTPGKTSGTTRIQTLSSSGIEGFKSWGYKILKEEPGDIDYNSTITPVTTYVADRDIRAMAGDYLLLLAMGDGSKIKSYDVIQLKAEDLRLGNAPPLTSVNYSNPTPGEKANTSKFDTLAFSTNILGEQWMVATSSTSFGTIVLDEIITGAEVYTAGKDIENVETNDYLLLLATDSSGKVKGYKEFRLTDSQIRGGETVLLENPRNYTMAKGSKPGSTKFDKLEFFGVADATRWKVKWLDTDSVDIPYMNQVVPNIDFYTKGNDIVLGSADNGYGWILLLAVDGSSRTKGYKVVPVDKAVVKEHAEKFDNLELEPGGLIDSVKFNNLSNLDTGNSYKYLISNTQPATPAVGDSLPNGVVDYGKDADNNYEDIPIHIGKYLSLYEVHTNDEIVRFSSFEVKKVNRGKATLTADILLEGNIVNGGKNFEITLENGATWNKDLVNNKAIRDKLFNGFKADNEASEWSKVVASMIADGNGAINIDSDTALTISLAETKDYNITEEQRISLTIPFEAIEGALNPIIVEENITIKPTIGATISGDVVSSIIREDDIIAGGKTIVVELADGTWATNVSGIINAFESSAGDNSNWEKIVKAFSENPQNGTITRNSGSKVTITLPKVSKDELKFDGKSEIISLEIDKDKNLIQGATENVVASPNFTLYPNMIQVEGEAVGANNTITLEAPDYRVIAKDKDIWIINVTNGTLNKNISDKDLVFTGLPRGLTANVSKVDEENQIQIRLTGTASAALSTDIATVNVKIKGSAVEESNSMDSAEIKLNLNRGTSIMVDLEKVKINVAEGMLKNTTNEMQYSLDSTNGSNGEWFNADSGTETKVNEAFKPGRVYVREASNHRIFYQVATLSHPKAPTGISVAEVDYKDNKIKLTGFETSTEYDISTDGGNTWDGDLKITDDISLTADLDLRVRLSATAGSLPSLATAKLNGLYLGAVELKVGDGLIANTNTSMQYSLDSTNGIDGRWASARANETPANFTAGNQVWIRQQTSKINYRELGEIKAQEEPDIETGIDYNILEKTISNDTTQNLEFKVNGGSWSKLGAQSTVDKVEFMPGSLEIRTAGTNETLPSKPKTLVSIPNPIDPPELKGDDDRIKTIHYLDESTNTWEELNDKFEYDIGNTGNWQSGEGFNSDKSFNETIAVAVRKKATKELLPSKEKSISFTQNLTFENIIFDIKNKAILGTTDKMEYSINSTDVMNGTWNTATNSNTTIEPFEGMYIWIREKNKPSTVKLYVDKLARQGIPELDHVHYNVATRKIANNSDYNLEYRINNGEWIEINAKSEAYEVDFLPGKFEFRQRATNKQMESNPGLKATIGAKKSGPNVVIDDVANTIELKGLDTSLIEYRINPTANSPWIAGELLDTEDLSGNKEIEIRIKATNFVLSSQVTKVSFTKNLDMDHVTLSTHVKPYELNGTTTQMEYRVWLTNGTDTWIFRDGDKPEWITASPDNTQLHPSLVLATSGNRISKIEIRDTNQVDNVVEVKLPTP